TPIKYLMSSRANFVKALIRFAVLSITQIFPYACFLKKRKSRTGMKILFLYLLLITHLPVGLTITGSESECIEFQFYSTLLPVKFQLKNRTKFFSKLISTPVLLTC